MMRTTKTLTVAFSVMLAGPALAHEPNGTGEHLSVGFYYGHDGTFEAPANPAEPASLLVDTHPWELDTVFYPLTPTDTAPFNGWTNDFPGYSSLAVEDEESSGHGYFSWQNPTHGVDAPDLRLHLVSKDPGLVIIDPGTTLEMTNPHVLGINTENHHLIYYVDQASGKQLGDVLTATFYLTDGNGGLAQSENFTVQFRISPELSPADFDTDGDVDGVDIAVMFANFNGPGGGVPADPATDLDGDNDVDGVDLAAFYGEFTGPLDPASVPEPSTLALLVMGGLLARRRRR